MSKETEKIRRLLNKGEFCDINFVVNRKDKRMWIEITIELNYGQKDTYFSEDLCKEEMLEIISFRINQLEEHNELGNLKKLKQEVSLFSEEKKE